MEIIRQVTLGLVLPVLVLAGEPDMGDAEWFFPDPEEQTSAVNEGTLEFLASPPSRSVHHHRNVFFIRPGSFRDGWVRFIQCHEQLDAVPRLEVRFREGRVRNLAVTDATHVARAWVEGPSVQLTEVRPGARLCIKGESKVLSRDDAGGYRLRNGPYMRRFLDGYYPMRISMEVNYPCQGVRLVGISPDEQPGFTVKRTECGVHIQAWFEGRLYTELRFLAN